MRRVLSEVRNTVFRGIAVPGMAVFLIMGATIAQSSAQDRGNKPAQPGSSDVAKDGQRKADEFIEAAQAINGPAGNPECVWLGRRVVRLMWLDDLDTAFRHLDLYDRFGAPRGP